MIYHCLINNFQIVLKFLKYLVLIIYNYLIKKYQLKYFQMIAKIGNSKNTKYLIVQIKIPMKNFLQYKLIELKLLYVIYIDCIYYYINLIYNFIVKKIYF